MSAEDPAEVPTISTSQEHDNGKHYKSAARTKDKLSTEGVTKIFSLPLTIFFNMQLDSKVMELGAPLTLNPP